MFWPPRLCNYVDFLNIFYVPVKTQQFVFKIHHMTKRCLLFVILGTYDVDIVINMEQSSMNNDFVHFVGFDIYSN